MHVCVCVCVHVLVLMHVHRGIIALFGSWGL